MFYVGFVVALLETGHDSRIEDHRPLTIAALDLELVNLIIFKLSVKGIMQCRDCVNIEVLGEFKGMNTYQNTSKGEAKFHWWFKNGVYLDLF